MFQTDWLDSLKKWLDSEEFAHIKETEKTGDFPRQGLLHLAREYHFFENLLTSLDQPRAFRSFLEAIRLISKDCASLASILLTHGIYVIWTIEHFATEEQKERYLPQLLSCQTMGAFAFSEQDISLKKQLPQTLAREVEGGWLLSGQKHMVSNVPHAGVLLVFAQTIRQSGEKGTGIFFVDTGAEGVGIGQPMTKSGMRSLVLAPVGFTEVFLDSAALMGDGKKEGLSHLSQVLVKMRLAISAQALGIAEGGFQKGLDLSVLKRGFGGRLIDVSVNQFKFADMEIRLAACEAVYHDYIQTDMTDPRKGALLKLLTTDTAQEIADEVVRIIGTYSFIEDNDLERYVHDSKITSLYGGSTTSLKRSVAQAWL